MKNNPIFSNIQTGEAYYDTVEDRASYKGVCIKTFIFLGITVLVAALVAFYLPTIITTGNFIPFYMMLAVASVVGFISVMIGRFKESAAKYAGVIYSICEGMFVGCLSALCAAVVDKSVIIAAFSTLVIFLVILTLYSTGILRVGSTFRRICMAMGFGAIALVLLTSIASIWVRGEAYFTMMIAVEAFLLIYGSITLCLNFNEADAVVKSGASKEAEWCVALGLIVSLIYIYVEILRLIILIAARNEK